ncbi:scavenger receptor cysteine-rich domain superfamily protein-like [Ruditapes philippinarum]|uniref:scavenger receptor cysteine-rich domain superfamily protein-like n=1 Tax=Ruditapes philippinarum TaxID=129788 RepID=UPI00295B26B1|nr:scavenger receptor cysteine-rich domain superfamily protein-like [Ruditapes philippinarum]
MDTWNLIVLIWFCGSSCYHCYGENNVTEIKVRLVGGRSIFEGRVEVYYNNTWGTVCDDLFDYRDAQVFCYMLGYERLGAQAKREAYFGKGNITIWLDDLRCNGTEISVDHCGKYRGLWGSHNCAHREDAGIVCQPKIRLTGGKTKNVGRVEIHYLSIWRTVCHDNFSNADAQVFCSMLGYERYGAEVFAGSNSFGNASEAVWLDVRLIGGLVEYEGLVEIFDSDDWRTVCSDGFTNEDAQVLCHMLGFPREDAIAYKNAYFGQGAGDLWFGSMGCSGHELSRADCKGNLFGFNNCSHSLDAGIRCKPRVRLVDGITENDGRVEVYHSGIWGTVCDDNFDSLNVQVLCFMLGYDRSGGVFYEQYSNPGNGTIWLDDLECTGQETSIDECDKKGNIWGSHNCHHEEDVGIKCRTKSGCTVLSIPENGNYSSTLCSSNISSVGTHCILLCHDGFKPLSENITTCLGTGLWNVSDIFMTCIDIDECENDSADDVCTQNCRNTEGSYDCYCNEGYIIGEDNATCNDINECNTDNGGCSHTCTNKLGSFVCNCFDGYSLENDNISCKDLNECNIRNGDCNQICINEDGSYKCDCNSGYYMTSDNLTCENECNRNNGGCDHECSNANGTFSCSCYRGYLLQSNNKSCDDINECSTNNGECEHVCINTNGAHECSCATGFILQNDTYSCKDKNECNYRNGGCAQICVNMIGNFECQCEKGYSLQGDNYSCTDINECDLSNGNCEQICANNQGSFSCACKDGFVLDEKGFVCDDIIECDIDNGGCQQLCHNLEGSFACGCTNGYVLKENDLTCKNVSGRSQSSSLRVKIGKSVVKDLKDPATYNYVREHLGTSLTKYFEDYATLKVSIAVQQILTIEEPLEEDTIIVGFTVIYDKETSLVDRENILQGILKFNKSKLLLYDGTSIPAVLVNEAPVISPTYMVVTLSENTSVGAVLGVFTVRDNDGDIRGDIHVYSQDKPEEISLGQITDRNVQIVLAGSVDVDKYQRRAEAKLGPVVNFTVVVKDKPGSKAIANVTLTINDINDNAPVCSPGKLTVKMPRDETIGTSIYNLNTICSDNDYYYNRIDFFHRRRHMQSFFNQFIGIIFSEVCNFRRISVLFGHY